MQRSTLVKIAAAGAAGMVILGLLGAWFVTRTERFDRVSADFYDAVIERMNMSRFASEGSPGGAPIVDNREFNIVVDAGKDARPISPLIYGVSAGSKEWMEETGSTLNNWGGNPSSRYNWELGNAWNAARDWEYRNGNYGNYRVEEKVADTFIREATEAGAETRISIPTLGWVASNDENDTCSFPLENGECGDGYEADCDNPVAVTDPTLANVKSDVEFIRRWMQHIRATHGENGVRIIGMDNEPELWGYTHYDVHPNCTTYQEIFDKYVAYATMVREELPSAELAGPVTCCWYYYWNSAAGRGDKWDNGNQDFLPWFLDQMREHDEAAGQRYLDILDLHYYPSSGIFNQDVSDRVSATRLRSTRALWDRGYRAESWIGKSIHLIPRMRDLIDEHYPGTKFGLSEWNFGAEESINGALAIADTLGIFGREDLYFATYWTHPPMGSPGYFAFKIFGNYDDKGNRFGDVSISAESDNQGRVSSYASLDSNTGNMHIMLINKLPRVTHNITLDIANFDAQPTALLYRYSGANISGINNSTARANDAGQFEMAIPPYSITHMVLRPQR